MARRRRPRRRRGVESGRAVHILSAVAQGDPENDDDGDDGGRGGGEMLLRIDVPTPTCPALGRSHRRLRPLLVLAQLDWTGPSYKHRGRDCQKGFVLMQLFARFAISKTCFVTKDELSPV